MFRRISHLIAVLTFLLAVTSLTSAQPPSPVECPTIVLEAARHTLAPDELARFTIRITPKNPEWKFRYHWTLTHGQPLTGQGTETITVRRPPGSVVDATVDIAGGPDDTMCPIASTDRAVWASGSDKSSDCPDIEVRGPAGILAPNQLAPFTALVELKGTAYKPVFQWSVSSGEIVLGQGTERVEVRQPNSSFTVTVELLGLPRGCTAVASETSSGPHPPPLAEKVGEIRNVSPPDVNAIRLFAAELKDNPNNQGFIFVGHPAGFTKDEMNVREQRLAKVLTKEDLDTFDGPRVTIVRRENTSDFAEFWRVPPGANNPPCRACEVPNVCPTITLSGPPGITEPGSIVEYSGEVGGLSNEGLSYVWTVVGGELIAGQGTLTPRIKPEGFWSIQVTATLEVKGLPEGCPNTASETYAVACNCQAILFDEFSIAPSKIDKRRLDALVAALTKYPDSKLHIIEYFQPGTPAAVVRKKTELIRTYLAATHGVKSSDFEVVVEASRENVASTRLYVIPPGANKPTP